MTTPTLPPTPSTIANLPLANTPLAGNELVPLSQGGVTKCVAANGFTVVGPQGPTGPTGATGPQGPAGGAANIGTGTVNDLAYYNTTTTLAALATANNGILVTSGAGVPSIGTAIPSGVTASTQSAANASTLIATTAFVNQGGLTLGTSTATTQSAADSSTKVATTAFVNGTALTLAAGTTATTQSPGDNSTKVATTAFVNGTALTLAAGTTATTQSPGDNSTKVATTAFVLANAVSTVVYNSISGCLMSSMAGTNTTASITVGSGQAADSTNAVYILSAGYSWAAANGNAINGTDASSSTLANSTTYHMYLCKGGSGTGTFVSATYPGSGVTFPTGYAVSYRRISSFNTNSSGAPIPYNTGIEIGGGAVQYFLTTQLLDINVSNQGTSRIAYALTVPTGIKVQPLFRVNGATSAGLIITSGDETDVAPATSGANWTAAPGYDFINNFENMIVSTGPWITNTSGQIGFRATTTSISIYLVTRGYIDFRRS